jgi:hypothetical protein
MVLVTIEWTGILIDQMPCFLSVPFCDQEMTRVGVSESRPAHAQAA